jgi:hypothetical protein
LACGALLCMLRCSLLVPILAAVHAVHHPHRNLRQPHPSPSVCLPRFCRQLLGACGVLQRVRSACRAVVWAVPQGRAAEAAALSAAVLSACGAVAGPATLLGAASSIGQFTSSSSGGSEGARLATAVPEPAGAGGQGGMPLNDATSPGSQGDMLLNDAASRGSQGGMPLNDATSPGSHGGMPLNDAASPGSDGPPSAWPLPLPDTLSTKKQWRQYGGPKMLSRVQQWAAATLGALLVSLPASSTPQCHSAPTHPHTRSTALVRCNSTCRTPRGLPCRAQLRWRLPPFVAPVLDSRA